MLRKATTFELENIRELGVKKDLFPTHTLGVAQGCCMSPLFGNVYLSAFDKNLNTGEVRCIRYIDDFIILGPTKEKAENTFNIALKILEKLELSAYKPGGSDGKAIKGLTNKTFDFLGCSISSGFVHPNKKTRDRLMDKVKGILNDGITDLTKGISHSSYDYNNNSMVNTIIRTHRVLEGWVGQYSFCNAVDLFSQMDRKIDGLLAIFIGRYNRKRSKATVAQQRRMLGVKLLSDYRIKNPIYAAKRNETRKR